MKQPETAADAAEHERAAAPENVKPTATGAPEPGTAAAPATPATTARADAMKVSSVPVGSVPIGSVPGSTVPARSVAAHCTGTTRRTYPTWVSIAGFVAVSVLVSLACWRLGLWQYHRYEQHSRANAAMAANLAQPPQDLLEVAIHQPEGQWRPVRVRGIYQRQQLLWRNSSHERVVGVQVMARLRTDSGQDVIIDRGWQPHNAALPALPSETVQVQGLLRCDQIHVAQCTISAQPLPVQVEPTLASIDQGGVDQSRVDQGGVDQSRVDRLTRAQRALGWDSGTATRAPSFSRLDLAALTTVINTPLLPVFVQATDEQALSSAPPNPAPADRPAPTSSAPATGSAAQGGAGLIRQVQPPMLSTSRHITYAWQWWLFALLAPVGFILLARRSRRDAALTERTSTTANGATPGQCQQQQENKSG